jgi:hypothetical protein
VSLMNDYLSIFHILLSSFLAYWFCGHSIAVALNGGPRGDAYYQRAVHPIRFLVYVVGAGIVGLVFASHAIYGVIRVWRTIVLT